MFPEEGLIYGTIAKLLIGGNPNGTKSSPNDHYPPETLFTHPI